MLFSEVPPTVSGKDSFLAECFNFLPEIIAFYPLMYWKQWVRTKFILIRSEKFNLMPELNNCLNLLWSIYDVWCCIAAYLGAPSLDSYFRQPALTSDSYDPPTYCGRCNTLLWKWDTKLSDTRWTTSTINVHPSSSQGLLFALMPLCRYLSLFLLPTTVKSAPSFCTASADCGWSAMLPNTLANVGDAGGGGRGEVGVEWTQKRKVWCQAQNVSRCEDIKFYKL